MSRLATILDTIATLVKGHDDTIGDSTMTTTAQTITGAVNELDADITSLNSNYGYLSSGSYNDIKKFGIYMCQSLTDAPSSSFSSYCLVVFGFSTTAKQIAFPTANDNNMYVRHYTGGSWSSWTAHVLP